MDQVLLENAARYQTLVEALGSATVDDTPKVTTEITNPNIIVSARIRPLLNEEVDAGVPCAIFPRTAETGIMDIHDLYNYPKKGQNLKVRKHPYTRIDSFTSPSF